MSVNYDEIKALFESKNQGHVFRFWDELNDSERQQLLLDCEQVDFDWKEDRLSQFNRESSGEIECPNLEPAPIICLPQTSEEKAAEAKAREIGEEALRAGRLAAFLVAGGQGTRLGFDGPKGCYQIGPNTGKTLFQWHAEQILARAKKHEVTIPWYIMTSHTNYADTVKYFEENNYLGFNPEDIMFFQQSMVPSFDTDGNLLLASKSSLAMNPDGHGGSLLALVKSGATADMKKRGIDTISYFQVDNPIVTICDPVFAGYHLQAQAQMSSKILDKSGPEEKVGHICICNGKTTVIEYSDMDFANMHARSENGKLVFWAGSIAIHMLSVDFVDHIGSAAKLPWHIARKKIPFINHNGKTVSPDKPNGVKFETFVFDALPMATASVTMEVDRATEFAPVKNASGIDSAESCRQMLSNIFASWLEKCGYKIERNAKNNTTNSIEISPLYALDAEELKSKLPDNFNISPKITLA